jgi:hypothetical protein
MAVGDLDIFTKQPLPGPSDRRGYGVALSRPQAAYILYPPFDWWDIPFSDRGYDWDRLPIVVEMVTVNTLVQSAVHVGG